MKTLQQLFATILLALALVVPALAGDMGGPTSPVPAPSPLPPIVVDVSTPPNSEASAISAGETLPLTDMALDWLFWALSVY